MNTESFEKLFVLIAVVGVICVAMIGIYSVNGLQIQVDSLQSQNEMLNRQLLTTSLDNQRIIIENNALTTKYDTCLSDYSALYDNAVELYYQVNPTQ